MLRTLLLVLMIAAPRASAAELLVLGANCVDPASRTIERRTLWLRDGVVQVSVPGPGYELHAKLGDGIDVLDAQGRFLLPGLVDARLHAGTQRSPGHVDHVGIEGTARLCLLAGVTTCVDVQLGAEALQWRTSAESGARVLVGGPVITAPRGVGSEFEGAHLVGDATEARALVRRLADRPDEARVDLLNVVFDRSRSRPGLAPETLRAVLEEADRADLPCAVQVGSWRDVADALDAGARWLIHLPEGDVPPSVLERIGSTTPFWSPTLALGQDFADLAARAERRSDPWLGRFLPEVMIADYGQVRVPQNRLSQVARERERRFATIAAFGSMGVRWIACSEAGAVGTAFGSSLLSELEWMNRAGIDAWDVLAAATTGAAKVLGFEVGFDEGDRADFLVLDRSPIDDLRTLRAPVAVVQAGMVVDLEAVAAGVQHRLEERVPESPLPGNERLSLILIVVAGFTVLLTLRAAIKRAAARAREEDGS